MICLQCQSDLSSENIKTKQWSVVKLKELKHRGFFVTSGNVHVRGWQLVSVNEDFSTDICAKCLEGYINKAHEAHIVKYENFKKWQKKLFTYCLPVGLAILAILIVLSFTSPAEKANLYLVSFMAICVIVPLVFSCFAPSAKKQGSKELENTMHKGFIEGYRKSISDKLDTEVRSLILHPEALMPTPPNMVLGMHFIVPQSALSDYKESKEKTGWSRIDYYHRDGNGIEGKYSPHLQSQNLRNFELQHWGEFLSQPKGNFESITGFFEIAVVEGQI